MMMMMSSWMLIVVPMLSMDRIDRKVPTAPTLAPVQPSVVKLDRHKKLSWSVCVLWIQCKRKRERERDGVADKIVVGWSAVAHL